MVVAVLVRRSHLHVIDLDGVLRIGDVEIDGSRVPVRCKERLAAVLEAGTVRPHVRDATESAVGVEILRPVGQQLRVPRIGRVNDLDGCLAVRP